MGGQAGTGSPSNSVDSAIDAGGNGDMVGIAGGAGASSGAGGGGSIGSGGARSPRMVPEVWAPMPPRPSGSGGEMPDVSALQGPDLLAGLAERWRPVA